MAWTKFTDYLEPGELLTKEKRDELLDAIEERMIALCNPAKWGWVGDPTPGVRTGHYQILDSRLQTARCNVRVTNFSGTHEIVESVHFLLDRLGEFYAKGSDSSMSWQDYISGTEFSGLTGYAANELYGYTFDQWQAISTPAVHSISGNNLAADEVREYWNVCRRAVMLLEIAYAEVIAPATINKEVDYELPEPPPPDETAAAIAAWLAGAEDAPAGGQDLAHMEIHGLWSFEGFRTDSVVQVPDHPMFADYDAWAGWITESRRGPADQTATFEFDGDSYETPTLVSDDYGMMAMGTGRSAVGDLVVRCRAGAYDNTDGQLNNIIDAMTDAFDLVYIRLNSPVAPWPGIFVKPTFTHPLEALP